MKIRLFFFVVFVAAIFAAGCGSDNGKGLTVKGSLQGATNLQVSLEKTGLLQTTPNLILAKDQISSSGEFKLNFPEVLSEGLYRLKVGEQYITLIFDGSERKVEVKGNLAQMSSYIYEVTGSATSMEYLTTIQQLISRQPTVEDIRNVINNCTNPLIGMLITVQAVGTDPSGLDLHQAAADKVFQKYPNSTYAQDYTTLLGQIQSLASSVGNPSGYTFVDDPSARKDAPDITLPNPSGKNYSLSSLKGKIVLLDFWASWCGPCRYENPNVVEVYNRYKNKGFTVFSVSLDGVDDSQAAMLAGDPAQLKESMRIAKESWKKAIADDGLTWEYHVSDLKKWDCAPAKLYGVSSIPRTFMIDRDGKIAALNLRGAEQIEETLKKLL